MKLILLVSFLVFVLFLRFVTFYQSQPVYKSGETVSVTFTLHEEPDLSNKGQKFSIKTSLNQIIFVTTKAVPRLHYGDQIQVVGRIQERPLERGGSLLVLYYPNVVVKDAQDNLLSQAALLVRRHNKQLFDKTLPPTSSGLLSGIVFGSKEHFNQDFKQRLSATGVLHVIAASGMNVSFLAAALLYVFGLFMKRQIALMAGCLGIIFYVFLVGFEPSIIRAAIMGLLTFGAGIVGRQNWAIFALGISGYMMLLWEPSFLFDVGFQLSFMATLGILLFGGVGSFRFGKLGPWGKVGELFRENIATTFSAQVATLPILLGVFGSVGIVSLLVNALVLWVVPIVMTIGGVAVLVGLLLPSLAQVILYVSLPFLLFFETVVSFFGGFGWNFEINSFPWPMVVGYYFLIASVVTFIKLKINHIHKP